MADAGRQRRIAERIRESVANTLERKVKDPRLGFVTVTDVRVTGDLQHATIFYTAMGDEQEQKKSARALQSAKGLIRSEVGAALGLRLTPTIAFQQDALPEAAASIEDALRAALARDAQIAAEAKGKEYAGGESPYAMDVEEVADEDEEAAEDEEAVEDEEAAEEDLAEDGLDEEESDDEDEDVADADEEADEVLVDAEVLEEIVEEDEDAEGRS